MLARRNHDNARPEFGHLIQICDYAPQRQPFFARARAGLNVGLDASGPVAVNIARHCLCVALGDCVVRGCESERIKIGKA